MLVGDANIIKVALEKSKMKKKGWIPFGRSVEKPGSEI